MILRVTQYGEPILRQKGERIEAFDDALVDLAEDMLETMYDAEGIGLAAQQVDRNLQLFVMDLQWGDRELEFDYSYDGKKPPLDLIMPLAVVNPEIQTMGPEETYEEGCLSFPDVRGHVVRDANVKLKFQDLEGNPHTIEANGIFGRCILHENDHLQGVLFTDRMEPKIARSLDSKIKKIKRKTRDFLKAQKRDTK